MKFGNCFCVPVVSASGVSGTVPIVLQGATSGGQSQLFLMKMPDGKLQAVRLAQRRGEYTTRSNNL